MFKLAAIAICLVAAAGMMLALTEDMKLQVAIANAIRDAEGQR